VFYVLWCSRIAGHSFNEYDDDDDDDDDGDGDGDGDGNGDDHDDDDDDDDDVCSCVEQESRNEFQQCPYTVANFTKLELNSPLNMNAVRLKRRAAEESTTAARKMGSVTVTTENNINTCA